MSSLIKQTKQLRDYKRVAEKLGASVEEVSLNGHYHITLSVRGHIRTFITASTSSDLRGMKNYKSQVKRWVREEAL